MPSTRWCRRSAAPSPHAQFRPRTLSSTACSHCSPHSWHSSLRASHRCVPCSRTSPGKLGTPAAWIVGVVALVGALIVIVGVVKSSRTVMLLGFLVLVFGGARWAIHAGDATIDHDTAVWISYLVAGGLFVVLGSFLMAKRHVPVEK